MTNALVKNLHMLIVALHAKIHGKACWEMFICLGRKQKKNREPFNMYHRGIKLVSIEFKELLGLQYSNCMQLII